MKSNTARPMDAKNEAPMNAAQIAKEKNGQDVGGGWWSIPCSIHGGDELRVLIKDGGKDGLIIDCKNCVTGCKRHRVLAALSNENAGALAPSPTVGPLAGAPMPATGHSQKTLRAIKFGEFIRMELPARELILDPWLHTQGLAMIHAPRGVGKTYFALTIALAVAAGRPFLDWNAPTPRGVLYLDGEMPAAAMQERMRQLSAAVGVPQAAFSLITPDLQSGGMPDLADPEWQRTLDEHIGDAIDLVVVDNVSTLVRSGKENEAESWEPVQVWALSLRARRKSVLFIHHSGKQGTQRGTSRREDVLDTVLALHRPVDYRPEQGAVFEVHFEKARGVHGKGAEPFEAALRSDGQEPIQWESHPLKQSQSTEQQVAALLAEGLTQTEIAKRLGVNKGTVSRYANKARESPKY